MLNCFHLLLGMVEPQSSRTTLVAGALLGAALVVQPLRDRSRSIATLALAGPVDGLVDGLCWGVGWPVGVELGIIACGVGEKSFVRKIESSAYPAAHTYSGALVSH